MGLQNQLNDVSSESIPILLVALIANCVRYLRSLLFTILHSLGLPKFHHDEMADDNIILDAVGSGLAGLIVLAEQLNLNRVFSYPYNYNRPDEGGAVSDCVVCLSRLSHGDHVRRLACRHVFHKECFDGWLDHLNFNCPLCRLPVVADESVSITERRVTDDLMTWFSLR